MTATEFTKKLILKFQADGTSQMAASVAFYTAFSFAPLLVIMATLASWITGDVRESLVNESTALAGREVGMIVQIVLDRKSETNFKSWAGWIGFATFVFSGSLIFGEIRQSLNKIYRVSASATTAVSTAFAWILGVIQDILKQSAIALVSALAVLLFMIFSSAITVFFHSQHLWWLNVVKLLATFIAFTGLFTLTFRYIPAQVQPWVACLKGGLFTALLFTIGNEAVGIYLAGSAFASVYGAAGSIIVLLAWVYYSSMIVFLGAQFSSLLKPSTTQDANSLQEMD